MPENNEDALRALWSSFEANATFVVMFVSSTLAGFFPLVGLGFGLWNIYVFPVPPGEPLFDYANTLGIAALFGLATACWYHRHLSAKIRAVAEQADRGDAKGAARRLGELTRLQADESLARIEAYLAGRARIGETDTALDNGRV